MERKILMVIKIKVEQTKGALIIKSTTLARFC
jgi:hypothetical protein